MRMGRWVQDWSGCGYKKTTLRVLWWFGSFGSWFGYSSDTQTQVIKLHRNKYYCSEFVYEVLSSDGIDILDKKEVLFQPEEIISGISNYNLIYEGEIKNF